jgi:uncharacterized membrane protein YdjX (TVP38/TMEM64 family)
MMKQILRWTPLALLLAGLVVAYSFGLFHYLTFDSLQTYHDTLIQWRDRHYALSLICYGLIYILCIAISIPGGLVLTLIGGFLFGLINGTLCVLFSATVGATLLFLAVQYSVGSWLSQKATPWTKKMEIEFQHNAFYYLLFLRLVPVFPFWIVNIVPGILNIPLRTFISATLIGILPGTFIYISVGNGLNKIFETGGTPNFNIIFTPAILLPLIGLAALSLVPIIYRKIRS